LAADVREADLSVLDIHEGDLVNAVVLHQLNQRFFRNFRPASRAIEFVIFFLFNSVVPVTAAIGSGSRFAYGGIGVVLHKKTRIGTGCVIGQGCTLGAKEPYVSNEPTTGPTVEENVYIGPGVRIVGDIQIGHSSVLAANSVVTKSVEPHSIMAGVPAKRIGTTAPDYLAIKP
jgi:serine O-acetyltransferase